MMQQFPSEHNQNKHQVKLKINLDFIQIPKLKLKKSN